MHKPSLSLGVIEAQFRDAMRAAGLAFDGTIAADGKLHRFRVDGDKSGSRNGWYVLHADGVPAGEFGSWKTGSSEAWHADIGRRLTRDEEREHRERIDTLRRQRDAEQARVRAEARKKAEKLWAEASRRVSVTHAYLAAKGVKSRGLRQLKDSLLVPLRDVDGQLHGLQFIEPKGVKKFLTGSAIAGHYFAMGKPRGRVVVCEGYATGATVFELLGDAVAVAFNAGNLVAVAKAIRAKLPALDLVIAADNDHGTAGNPGLTQARAAAQAVGGVLIAPEFAAGEAGTDWNDYAAQHGVDATREALRVALARDADRPQGEPARGLDKSATAPAPAAPVVVSLDARRRAKSSAQEPAAMPAPAQRADYPAGFTLDAGGVWFRGRGKDGDSLEPPFRVCPPLRVVAYLRDTGNENWGLLLEFEDNDSVTHRWALPWQMLKGSGEEMRGELLRLGFFVPMAGRARTLLGEYLSQARPKQTARSVERVGWHERVFVMPESTIGEAAEPVFFQCETTAGHIYRERGELAEWRSDIADLCRGNSRLVFAISAALAGPLLHWAGDESGGFNLRGPSSCGKTTALRVAASVWGGPSYVRRWRATDNALEAIATQHSDSLLVLDELAQIDPRIAGEAAYMLANGEGKARGGRGGGSRPVLTWRTLFLSAGEVSLAEHMRQGGKQSQAGQEARMADVPAEAGTGFGIFESLHGCASGAALSRALVESCALAYGVAGPAFLRALLPRLDALPDDLKLRRRAFLDRHVPKGADGQVVRVAGRFALVAAAGELASDMGITGWERGEAERAAERCLLAWIEARGGGGNLEPMRMLAAVRHFLELHGSARFPLLSDAEKESWVTVTHAGFREIGVGGDASYYVLAEVFEREVCEGFDPRAVARVLKDAGALRVTNEAGGRLKVQATLPRFGRVRCYHVLPAIWLADAAS